MHGLKPQPLLFPTQLGKISKIDCTDQKEAGPLTRTIRNRAKYVERHVEQYSIS